jgi:DNA-binding Lrp family transcriptional regulator
MVDALDLKIIEKLKINSRVSYVDIGKHSSFIGGVSKIRR